MTHFSISANPASRKCIFPMGCQRVVNPSTMLATKPCDCGASLCDINPAPQHRRRDGFSFAFPYFAWRSLFICPPIVNHDDCRFCHCTYYRQSMWYQPPVMAADIMLVDNVSVSEWKMSPIDCWTTQTTTTRLLSELGLVVQTVIHGGNRRKLLQFKVCALCPIGLSRGTPQCSATTKKPKP